MFSILYIVCLPVLIASPRPIGPGPNDPTPMSNKAPLTISWSWIRLKELIKKVPTWFIDSKHTSTLIGWHQTKRQFREPWASCCDDKLKDANFLGHHPVSHQCFKAAKAKIFFFRLLPPYPSSRGPQGLWWRQRVGEKASVICCIHNYYYWNFVYSTISVV